MPKLTLSFKGKFLKYFPLREGESIIGSDPGCAVFIDSLAIQSQHASVIRTGQTVVLRDLDTPDGTFVNETRLTAERELKEGDTIRVGKHTLTFALELPAVAASNEPTLADDDEPIVATAPEEPAPPLPDTSELDLEPIRPPRHAFLQIMNGQNVGKTISLNRRLTNLGKPGVQTAVIAHRNDGYFLSHLEGDTPPKIGEVSIGDKAWRLEDGDVIQISNIRMQFYLK